MLVMQPDGTPISMDSRLALSLRAASSRPRTQPGCAIGVIVRSSPTDRAVRRAAGLVGTVRPQPFQRARRSDPPFAKLKHKIHSLARVTHADQVRIPRRHLALAKQIAGNVFVAGASLGQ